MSKNTHHAEQRPPERGDNDNITAEELAAKLAAETAAEAADAPVSENFSEAKPADAEPETVEDPTVKLQLALAEMNDRLLRLQADYENYRRRMSKELGDARRVGLCETIIPFLNVFDLFDMAINAAQKSDNIAAIRQGQEMILTEFNKALDELGVKSFDATGKAFDPSLHDAISSEASATVPEGTVIRQWNCGYKLGDKLLRPARVVVSSGSADAEGGK